MKVDGHETRFKLDTGEAVSIVSDQEPWLKEEQLKKSQQILRGPGGTILSVVNFVGEFPHLFSGLGNIGNRVSNQAQPGCKASPPLHPKENSSPIAA